MPSFRISWQALVFASSGFLIAGCSSDDPQEPLPPSLVIIQSIEALHSEGDPWRFSGTINSVTQTDMAFQVSGRLEKVLVANGTPVKRGQVLAELDATDYRLRVRDAKANLDLLTADLKRKRQLLAEGILAPAAVEPVVANQIAAQVALDMARREESHTRLRAPFDGVVARRHVETGTVLEAGSPIFTFQDNRFMEVDVDIPESVALQIPFDATLQVQGTILSQNLSLPLVYKEHATQPDERARTYRVRLRGDRPNGVNLLPGMAVRVKIPRQHDSGTANAYQVPVSAVVKHEDGNESVWVVDSDRARHIPVKMMGFQGELAVIESERLSPGSKIVVAGASKLQDEQQVRFQERTE
ncbi:hypothetical protein BVH03_20990 [Pseudomonas sp. PA15(2017)]|uniref:efflux RND transporter periplasmic adaptor subunit n=1 Tax=Pseudomonas sp. PA15(2017) TaxID=1932111 RepID=UPI00095B3CBA|nr:efflux RND transporter periplasmic adaptor subunit [Pseudomonas sp. PA15(2017)]OLU23555.1 hypothetical protein BVH03_20990 [Pseudomonas sp. PA15(2017)]